MLNKEVIVETQHIKGKFIRNLFFTSKKDEENLPVINLKSLNEFTSYQHFKKEGLHCLGNVSKKGDYMCKLDLKDAYFPIPLNPTSTKSVRFLWSGKLYVSGGVVVKTEPVECKLLFFACKL